MIEKILSFYFLTKFLPKNNFFYTFHFNKIVVPNLRLNLMKFSLLALEVENYNQSNKLWKFYYLKESNMLLKFIRRLLKKGDKYNYIVMENFLSYLKYTTSSNSLFLFSIIFFSKYILPFKISVITYSNRRYYFPTPFDNENQLKRFFLKKFGLTLSKRSETFYLARFFNELISYLTDSSISFFKDLLDDVVAQGLENRAYVHYRWRLLKK